ncbi:MAG: transglutaminase-like domain-containing protein [Myxococcota bacterium]
MKHRTLPLLLLALVAAAASPAPQTRSERMTLYVDGALAGTSISLDEPLPDGGWRLTRQANLKVRRGEQELSLRSESVSEVDADLTPRRFRYVRDEASGRLVHEGTVACQGKGAQRKCIAKVEIHLDGSTTPRTVELPAEGTVAAALEVRVRRELKDGATYRGEVLVEELAGLAPSSYRVRKEKDGFVVESELMGVKTVERLDASGKLLRSEVPLMNLIAVPEGAPPPAGAQGIALDVLARSTWDAPELPSGVKRVRFELKARGDGELSAVPQDRRQRVLRQEKGRMLVEVVREPSGVVEVLTPKERERALAATPYEPVGDPRIVEAARKARGKASTPREIVKALTLWVHRTVSRKDLSRAYAPATATLQSRQGDCTEHSVLLSALLKASGIPARLVDGVIAFESKLGYHEWVEAYLDGEGWVPVDPTFGEPVAGPNRVKFITGSSDPSDLMAMGLSAAQAFRGLTVSIEGFDEK